MWVLPGSRERGGVKRKLPNEPSEPHSDAPTEWLNSLQKVMVHPQENLYLVLTQ